MMKVLNVPNYYTRRPYIQLLLNLHGLHVTTVNCLGETTRGKGAAAGGFGGGAGHRWASHTHRHLAAKQQPPLNSLLSVFLLLCSLLSIYNNCIQSGHYAHTVLLQTVPVASPGSCSSSPQPEAAWVAGAQDQLAAIQVPTVSAGWQLGAGLEDKSRQFITLLTGSPGQTEPGHTVPGRQVQCALRTFTLWHLKMVHFCHIKCLNLLSLDKGIFCK